VHQAIEAETQPVGVAVGDPQMKAVDQHGADVGDAIAIAVGQVDQFRWRQHQHTVLPGHHRGRKAQPVGEQGRLVGESVAVGVAEPTNRAAGSPPRVDAIGIIPHLDDVAAAVGGERQSDRVDDQWLGGPEPQFDVRVVLEAVILSGVRLDGEGWSGISPESAREDRHRQPDGDRHGSTGKALTAAG